MNRDEALTRGPELPPRRHVGEGVPWIAPVDSDRGGTWMGVNQYGVAACLLNAYRPDEDLRPDPDSPYPSRGAIIPSILPLGNAEVIDDYLRNDFDPMSFPSFTLFVAALGQAACYEWFRDGGWAIEHVPNPWHMRTSTGWDTTGVKAWRSERFNAWLDDGAPLVDHAPTFHFLSEQGAEVKSPLMRRPWSITRSVTQAEILLDSRAVLLRYWANPQPGGGPADTVSELELL